MRSLKIIIFRDTDKPYTMILSSRLIIGLAFGSIAVLSLFTFSVMSNVMLVSNGHQQPELIVETPISTEIPDKSKEATDDQTSEETEKEAEDIAAAAKETEEGDIQPEGSDDDPLPEEFESTQQTEPEITTAEVISPFDDNSEVEVVLFKNLELNSDSIQVPIRVRKITQPGVTARGRFIAALIHKDGSLGPSYPEVIQFDEKNPVNPDRGTPFRIQYMRDYNDVIFNNINPEDYVGIAVFLYDQNGTQLIWRNMLPITR